jgi:hypothetical protein
MRYLMVITPAKTFGPPPPAMVEAMNKMMAESSTSGTLLDGGEFSGAQGYGVLRLQGGKVVELADGPYAEAKEAIGGFAILEYATHEAAVKGTHEFLGLHAENWPGWEGLISMHQLKPHHR